MKGKSNNRCRRGHILLSTVLHCLHFQRFLKDNEIDELILCELKEWGCSGSNEIPDNLEFIATQYQLYCDSTASGLLGKTASFWMIYCHLVNLYLLFRHAMKLNDVDLFAYALHKFQPYSSQPIIPIMQDG